MCIRFFFNIEMQLMIFSDFFFFFLTLLLHNDKYVQFSATIPHPNGLVIVPESMRAMQRLGGIPENVFTLFFFINFF